MQKILDMIKAGEELFGSVNPNQVLAGLIWALCCFNMASHQNSLIPMN